MLLSAVAVVLSAAAQSKLKLSVDKGDFALTRPQAVQILGGRGVDCVHGAKLHLEYGIFGAQRHCRDSGERRSRWWVWRGGWMEVFRRTPFAGVGGVADVLCSVDLPTISARRTANTKGRGRRGFS